MSSDVKVRGTLIVDQVDELAELLRLEEGFEAADELAALIEEGVEVVGAKVSFYVEAHLSNTANLEFQDWLSDVAELASEGYVDTWQETFETRYVRLHAGGGEEEIEGTFPLLDS